MQLCCAQSTRITSMLLEDENVALQEVMVEDLKVRVATYVAACVCYMPQLVTCRQLASKRQCAAQWACSTSALKFQHCLPLGRLSRTGSSSTGPSSRTAMAAADLFETRTAGPVVPFSKGFPNYTDKEKQSTCNHKLQPQCREYVCPRARSTGIRNSLWTASRQH